jgi:hypothetical protein
MFFVSLIILLIMLNKGGIRDVGLRMIWKEINIKRRLTIVKCEQWEECGLHRVS